MEPYAVIATGGKQYRVQAGETLAVERLDGEAGQTVVFGEVLAISDGNALTVGAPRVAGAQVTAEIVKQFRGPKVIAFKKKRRKGYKKKIGHRQALTAVKITALQAPTRP